MNDQKYKNSGALSILLGIVAFAALLTLIGSLSTVVKWVGMPLLYLPARLGFIQMAQPSQIQEFNLRTGATTLTLPEAGQYAFYTGNFDLLQVTNDLESGGGEPWLKVTSTATGAELNVAFVARGLLPFDTPYTPGRPIFTFKVDDPGEYTLTGLRRDALVAVLPDYVTGSEGRLLLAVAAELLIFGVPVVWLIQRSAARRRARLQEVDSLKRIRSEDLWKVLRQKNDQNRSGPRRP